MSASAIEAEGRRLAAIFLTDHCRRSVGRDWTSQLRRWDDAPIAPAWKVASEAADQTARIAAEQLDAGDLAGARRWARAHALLSERSSRLPRSRQRCLVLRRSLTLHASMIRDTCVTPEAQVPMVTHWSAPTRARR